MKFTKHAFSMAIFLLVAPIFVLSGNAYGRSLYAVTKCYGSTLTAYDIVGDEIVYQIDTQIDTGTIGLALDPESGTIFATYDKDIGGYQIVLVNAERMQQIDSIPVSDELSGIVYDQSKQKVYAVSREGRFLYVYSWNPISQTLTQYGEPKILGDPDFRAYGLALDEVDGILYVTDATNSVKYYDADDPNFGYLGSVDITVGGNNRQAVGIDFYRDSQGNKYLYTGAWAHSSYHNYLVRTDINDVNNPSSDQHDVGAGVISVAVDQTTGYVYVTTSNNHIEVYNNLTFPSKPCDTETSDISGPADIIVRGDVLYKPPAFYLEKIDVNEPNCVFPGDYITYKITYGPNGLDHNNVVITDYLPCQVDYINPFDPNYDDVNHTYKWQIGSLSASAPNDFVTLTVCVNLGVEPNGIITNYCEIESDNYCSFAFADTNVCFWSPDIIYVDVNAVGCGSGLSWEYADPNLQRALWKAQAWDVNQIRVAQGTFKPTARSDTGARTISFELLDDVAVYGGFPSGGGTLSERNPSAYETILSGDIGTPVDQNDNSYHVVQCQNINNAIFDGFTIKAGYADATSLDEPNRCGGGICCKNSNVIKVANCTIIQNEGFYGGGIYNYNSPSLMITNCTFSDNTSFYGGAIYNNYSSSDVNITNCVFTGNTAKYYGGGILNYNSSPAVTNCVFSENQAEGYATYCGRGGGIANYQSSPMITNCTFIGNYVLHSGEGGGMYNRDDSSPSIKYCIFSGNLAGTNGGGLYNSYSYPKIANCIFTGNKANNDKGGGIYNSINSEPNITNCIFTGNKAEHYGGGIYNTDSTLKVSNSVFAGNIANYNGGGIYNYQCPTTLTNCTFSGNRAGYGGGIYNWYSSDSAFTNCIFWDNEANAGNEIYNNSDLSVTYCDVKGGWEGTGNINEDPCFFEVGDPDGSWTSASSYYSSTFQSTLTDSSANWAVNELAGRFVNPDTNQNLQFFIVSNGVNTIKVWSNVESIATNGKPYQIYDYHLCSDSICIDRGDPEGDYAGQTDIDGEPRVFDGDANETEIVDMGADEYYWSPADFNSDGLVNFFDYAFFASAWQSDPNDPNYNEDCDLEDNNSIDYNDLARFCEDWLWQTAWAKTFPFAYGQTMGRGMGMTRAVSESIVVTEGLYPSVLTKEEAPEVIEVDIEVIVKWLFELWLTDDELRKMISEDEWLKFIESVVNIK